MSAVNQAPAVLGTVREMLSRSLALLLIERDDTLAAFSSAVDSCEGELRAALDELRWYLTTTANEVHEDNPLGVSHEVRFRELVQVALMHF